MAELATKSVSSAVVDMKRTDGAAAKAAGRIAAGEKAFADAAIEAARITLQSFILAFQLLMENGGERRIS
jgi:hypothetical protein